MYPLRYARAAVALVGTLLFAPSASAHEPLPSSSIKARGLRAPVEILEDRWGVSHIYASSREDVFFAQGFNAARQRLWQMDLWRRRGLGRLAEALGPRFIDKDRAARLFLYNGDMRREWRAYGADTQRIMSAFVAGINEYIRQVEGNPELLPMEFKLLGYAPARWSPEDVVRIRSHGLSRNLRSEVARLRILRDFGPRVEALRSSLAPPHEIVFPDGLEPFLIPSDALRVYDLATQDAVLAEHVPDASSQGDALAQLVAQLHDSQGIGSNNWAVSPRRTATGRPILANDPHRPQSIPSLRYIVHLVAPGLNVIGATEPVLPGISIGHNERIAFGLTIFAADQEDLYVYETNPANPAEYRYQGRWEPMKTETQTLAVRGGAPVEVTLRYTRHGPVLYEDPSRHLALAVRAAWLSPGMAQELAAVPPGPAALGLSL
jgi:penicillin G amidase